MRRKAHPERVRPAFVRPMAALLVDRLPEGDAWLYEVKFDGYRALLIKNAASVHIRSRNDKDLTSRYPPVAGAAKRLSATTAVVDGELVAVDAAGQPSFQALQHRETHAAHVVAFYAFDLLHLNGEDLTRQPLEARRAQLPAVIRESGLLLSESLTGSVAQITEAVGEAVARRADPVRRVDGRGAPAARGVPGAARRQAGEGCPARETGPDLVCSGLHRVKVQHI